MIVKRAMNRVLVAVSTLGVCGAAAGQTVEPSVRYLGQAPPGTTPVRFAPGIVSTPAIEINAVFRPDFQEFFFARQADGVFTLFRSTLSESKWSNPEALRVYPTGSQGMAVDMAYSPDGRELYFLGRFKPGVPQAEAPLDIWVDPDRNDTYRSLRPNPPERFAENIKYCSSGETNVSPSPRSEFGGLPMFTASPKRPSGSR